MHINNSILYLAVRLVPCTMKSECCHVGLGPSNYEFYLRSYYC